jgi:outer membrane protein
MMRRFSVLGLAFLVALIGSPAFAQFTLKVGVADTGKAIRESIWGKKIVQTLEAEVEAWKEKGAKLDKEVLALEEKLAEQRSSLADAEEEKRIENEIGVKRLERQAFIQEGNTLLAQKRQQLVDPISSEIKRLIRKLATEEGYDMILEKQVTIENYTIQPFLYLNPELDITSRVIVMLDEVYRERTRDTAEQSEEEEKTDEPAPEEGQ